MVLVLDPPSKKSVFKAPRFQANIVFISQDHPDHNGLKSIAGEPFLINGPGEYEAQGVTIHGVSLSSTVTAYVLNLEGVNLCYLSSLDKEELSPEVQEVLGSIDILFVPSFDKMTKTINQVAPKIIIPMSDNLSVDKAGKAGTNKIQPIEKFTIKKKDMADKKEEIILLKPLLN